MRAFPGIIGRTLVGISCILAAACSGDPTASPAPSTTATAATNTPTASATAALTATPSVLPTPPGEGTFQLIAQFAAPLEAPLSPDTDSDALYLANGDVVLSLEPAAGSVFELHPIVSPDGRLVANGGDLGLTRTTIEDGLAISTGRIATLGELGTGLMYPCAWTPDSLQVLFAFRREGSAVPDGYGLYNFDEETTVVLDEANVRAGSTIESLECPALDSAGGAAWLAGVRDGDRNLWRLPLDGGAAEPVVAAGLNARGMPVVAGGRVVVEVAGEITADGSATDTDIVAVDPTTGDVSRLTDDPAFDLGPALSPDGTMLAFVSTRGGTTALYTMPVDGGAAVSVAAIPEAAAFAVTAISWSPDGTRVAICIGAANPAGYYIVEIAGGGVSALGSRIRYGFPPSWFTDGTGIIF